MSVYQDKQRKTYYYDFKHNGKHYKKRGFRLKSEALDAEMEVLLSLSKDPDNFVDSLKKAFEK